MKPTLSSSEKLPIEEKEMADKSGTPMSDYEFREMLIRSSMEQYGLTRDEAENWANDVL